MMTTYKFSQLCTGKNQVTITATSPNPPSTLASMNSYLKELSQRCGEIPSYYQKPYGAELKE